MSTWIFRSLTAALAGLLLAGCGQAISLPFATEPTGQTQFGGRKPLKEISLAGGQIKVSAPDGYCFDRRSIRHNAQRGFAVMARCDALGVRGFFGAHDLAIATITTVPQAAGARAPTLAELAKTGGDAKVLSRQNRDGLALIRFDDGPHQVSDVSKTHWRGAFALNGQLVGLALYAPEGSDALNSSGAALLSDLTRRTRKASNLQAQLEE